MYTGNHRDADWNRKPMQIIAVMNADGEVEKWDEAVIKEVPKGFTDHFRDPKVWKKGNKFYAIIGAQRTDKTGSVVLYESTDLLKWTYLGEIDTELTHFGYMWECPDYFELADRGILMFSPQGLDAQGDNYQNIYQSGYLIGNRLDMNSLKFTGARFEELDNGFDFYAPQTFKDGSERQILVGWMGLPDIDYPTDKNDWAHCLTLPRELTLVNGKLYQKPVKELEKLRQERHEFSGIINGLTDIGQGKCYELMCSLTQIEASEVGLNLRVGKHEKTVLKYDIVNKKIILDRSEAGVDVATEYGVTRKIPYCKEDLKLRIFVDTSSIEIFINEGESVMTSRIFPTNDENKIQLFSTNGSSHVNVIQWII
jgi:beta-fructofuranosidase